MKVSLKGLLTNAAAELENKTRTKYAKGYAFMLTEMYQNLEEVRADKTKINEFFELYVGEK